VVKPYHQDGCGHVERGDIYVGSFEHIHYAAECKVEQYDVYLYEDVMGLEVCLRFGSKCHEYLSTGPICQLFQGRDSLYHKAVKLLIDKGRFSWEPKE